MINVPKDNTTVRSCLSFVRYCIDERQCIPAITSWNALFAFMKEQALLGVGFCGIERMKREGVDVPREVLLQWYAVCEQIRKRNVLMNKKCVELVEMLRKDGFESCILKGQGNTVMYPESYSRMSGDIDVWLKKNGEATQGDEYVREVIRYAKEHHPEGIAAYHHVDYGDFDGVEVELHYLPAYISSPIVNARLREWQRRLEGEQFSHKVDLPDGAGQIAIPTIEFNIVYQLLHLIHHVFDEGIGLRQMMDYYYLLRKAKDEEISKREYVRETLKWLNMEKFAGAVMWVLHEVFGLEEELMIVPQDERRGKFLLGEILYGGNFGKYAPRGSFVRWNNSFGSLLRHIEHDIHLLLYFPSESLWEPIFRVYMHFWRKRMNP